MWWIYWVLTSVSPACSISCPEPKVSAPTHRTSQVPRDATFVFPVTEGESADELSLWREGGEVQVLYGEQVDGVWLFQPTRKLAANTSYTLHQTGAIFPITFKTGSSKVVEGPPAVPTQLKSSFHKRRPGPGDGCNNAHERTTLRWQGDAPLYEISVLHEGIYSTITTTETTAILGTESCTRTLDLVRGDHLYVRVRAWDWNGDHSGWTQESQLGTGGCNTSALPSGWYWALALAGMLFQRRPVRIGRIPHG